MFISMVERKTPEGFGLSCSRTVAQQYVLTKMRPPGICLANQRWNPPKLKQKGIL